MVRALDSRSRGYSIKSPSGLYVIMIKESALDKYISINLQTIIIIY